MGVVASSFLSENMWPTFVQVNPQDAATINQKDCKITIILTGPCK